MINIKVLLSILDIPMLIVSIISLLICQRHISKKKELLKYDFPRLDLFLLKHKYIRFISFFCLIVWLIDFIYSIKFGEMIDLRVFIVASIITDATAIYIEIENLKYQKSLDLEEII